MKNIFPIFALVTMLLFCSSIFVRFVVKNVLIDNGIENKFTDMVFFDAKQYKEQKGVYEQYEQAVKKKLNVQNYEEIIRAENNIAAEQGLFSFLKLKVEEYSGDLLMFRKKLVEIANFMENRLGLKTLPNGVIDLGDGYLAKPLKQSELQDIDFFVNKMVRFKKILDSLNIPIVYIQYPNVINEQDSVAKSMKDVSNYAKNILLQKLKQNEIPIIDLRKEFHNDHSLFYKTDHHWTAKTALLSAKIISENLNKFYGFNLDTNLLSIDNFTEEKFEKQWLGSMGKKVIPLYPKEYFYIYHPKYKTDIDWTLYLSATVSDLYQSSGSFDSLYHFLGEVNDDASFYVVAYPNYSFSINNNLPQGKKLLLISDSYADILSKFFAVAFKDVYFFERKSGLLNAYLANKPDIVIIGFNNAAIAEPLDDLLF